MRNKFDALRTSTIIDKSYSEKQDCHRIGNYIVQTKLGEGAFGSVHKCRSCLDNQTYVIKKVKTRVDGGGAVSSLNEATLMMKLKHRSIVRYVDSFIDRDYMYLVMEYCDRGDLQ